MVWPIINCIEINEIRNITKNEIPPRAGLDVGFQRICTASLFLVPKFFEKFKSKLLMTAEKIKAPEKISKKSSGMLLVKSKIKREK